MLPISHSFGQTDFWDVSSHLPFYSRRKAGRTSMIHTPMMQYKNKSKGLGRKSQAGSLPDFVHEMRSLSLGMGNSCHPAARYNPPSTAERMKKGIVSNNSWAGKSCCVSAQGTANTIQSQAPQYVCCHPPFLSMIPKASAWKCSIHQW